MLNVRNCWKCVWLIGPYALKSHFDQYNLKVALYFPIYEFPKKKF